MYELCGCVTSGSPWFISTVYMYMYMCVCIKAYCRLSQIYIPRPKLHSSLSTKLLVLCAVVFLGKVMLLRSTHTCTFTCICVHTCIHVHVHVPTQNERLLHVHVHPYCTHCCMGKSSQKFLPCLHSPNYSTDKQKLFSESSVNPHTYMYIQSCIHIHVHAYTV